MSNVKLRDLAIEINDIVHATPDELHGFDEDDVMAAGVLLHAIVMEVGSAYLLSTLGVENASRLSSKWGRNLHKQILSMTGVDTHNHPFPGVRS